MVPDGGLAPLQQTSRLLSKVGSPVRAVSCGRPGRLQLQLFCRETSEALARCRQRSRKLSPGSHPSMDVTLGLHVHPAEFTPDNVRTTEPSLQQSSCEQQEGCKT